MFHVDFIIKIGVLFHSRNTIMYLSLRGTKQSDAKRHPDPALDTGERITWFYYHGIASPSSRGLLAMTVCKP